MKKILFTILVCLSPVVMFADSYTRVINYVDKFGDKTDEIAVEFISVSNNKWPKPTLRISCNQYSYFNHLFFSGTGDDLEIKRIKYKGCYTKEIFECNIRSYKDFLTFLQRK